MTKFLFIGTFPNSYRQIEPELMRILIHKTQLEMYSNLPNLPNHVHDEMNLLTPKSVIGSLSITNLFNAKEMEEFLQMSREVFNKNITGAERFPGRFLLPKRIHVKLSADKLQYLANYYASKYNLNFWIPGSNLREGIFVNPYVDEFGRLEIAGEIYGSAMST